MLLMDSRATPHSALSCDFEAEPFDENSWVDILSLIEEGEVGQPLTKPFKHEGSVRSASFSVDGTRVVTASEDKTARVWRTSPSTRAPHQRGLAAFSITSPGNTLMMKPVFPQGSLKFLVSPPLVIHRKPGQCSRSGSQPIGTHAPFPTIIGNDPPIHRPSPHRGLRGGNQ